MEIVKRRNGYPLAELRTMIAEPQPMKFAAFNLIYFVISAIFLFAEQVLNVTEVLPHPTVAGLGLTLAGIGGIFSYLYELWYLRHKRASIRSNVAFAVAAALIVGLLSYDITVKYLGVNWWLGFLTGCGFANQVVLGTIRVATGRRVKDFFNVRNKELDELEASEG